ncbi:MAG: hypothetical protein NVS9B13_00550 [Candidatus Acidiferrum sp.]
MGLRNLLRYLCGLAALLAPLVIFSSPQEDLSVIRLLNVDQGLTLVNTALGQEDLVKRKPDCSHLVYQIYELAGFSYPYASSFDLYDGIDNFQRVATPHPGDLVVWRGHVGIAVDAAEHTFYSSVRSGLRIEDYNGPYWRAHGRPRFYRYILQRGTANLTADNPSAPPNDSVAQTNTQIAPLHKTMSDRPPSAAAMSAKLDPPVTSPSAASPMERPRPRPSSIMIVTAGSRPTNDEVSEAISEFNSASGNVLRSWPPADPAHVVVIYDQLTVERLELKRDRGWAHVEIEKRLSIDVERFEGKRRREKLRWEMRRTPQGWQLLAPPNRTYVSREVAVRFLASQLALLAQNDPASDDAARALRQQTGIVRALGFLFEPN